MCRQGDDAVRVFNRELFETCRSHEPVFLHVKHIVKGEAEIDSQRAMLVEQYRAEWILRIGRNVHGRIANLYLLCVEHLLVHPQIKESEHAIGRVRGKCGPKVRILTRKQL